MRARALSTHPIHLDRFGKAVPQPEFTDERWYEDYGERTASDGAAGRLVSVFSFTESWTSWEMHPAGAEVVVCIAGEITLIQELPDGSTDSVTLRPKDYAINPPGVWHTADVAGEATALFITAGMGTENRPR